MRYYDLFQMFKCSEIHYDASSFGLGVRFRILTDRAAYNRSDL
jgi:hypothetical protein